MPFGFFTRYFNITFGTFGADTITGGDGRDLVFGRFGNDLISTGGGRDTVWAGFGNDTVDAGDGNDRVFAGWGNDVIIAGAGDDRIDGGKGYDTAVYAGSVFDYFISTHGRTTSVTGADGADRLTRVETLQFDDATIFLDGRNNDVIARDDTAETEENTTLTLSAAALVSNDFDFDGDVLELTGVSATSAAGAAVTLTGDQISYDPGTLFDSLGAGDTTTDTFTYTVTDNQGSTSTATVTVTITGTNDAPVLTVPNTATIAENTSGVVATASVTDAEGDAITLSLSGDDAAFFSVDRITGAITLDGALDFEAPLDADGDNIYELTVTADDGNGGIASDTLSVEITDEAEGPLQLTQSFETESDGSFYFAPETDGSDPLGGLNIGDVVDLVNATGDDITIVDSTDASAGLLGFDAEWENTRGDVGLSDGDFVGVTDFTGTVGAFTDGVQGYQISDPDGLYRLRFDEIDLSSTGAVLVSLDIFVQSTGWESDDAVSVYVITDQGEQILLDTTGLDIDDLGIEGDWLSLEIELDADVNTAQLVVELDANSASEALYIDNILIEEAPEPFTLTQSFETESDGDFYFAPGTDGTVLAIGDEVDLENAIGDDITIVDSTDASAGLLGFDATWVNTRGDAGLSDGDFVGVTDFTGTVGSFTDGTQGYQISDPDGLYRLSFDAVDLTDVGAVTVSLDYFLQETGWETSDLLKIFVVTDQGTQTLLDTAGQDIDDLGIEGAWNTLSVDLGADITSAQLVVEFDSNSASEAVYLDNIAIADTVAPAGAALSVTADADTVAEGDSGTTSVTFTVTRTGDTTGATTVDFTVGGDVDADDFGGALPSGTVTFAPGETTQTVTVDITGDTTIEPDEALTVTLTNPSTDASIDTGTAATTILNDDAADVTIAAIQGSGTASALEGQTVSTSGIITYVEPDGFYMQMGTGDGDTATSDAIFVFVGNNALQNPDGSLNDGGGSVVIGNDVTVTGEVSEFGALTQLETSLAAVTVNSTGNALPGAVTVEVSPDTNAAVDYEATEGMRVEVVSGDPTEALTVITNFNLDRFGEITVSAGTQTQPTQLFDAQTEQAQVQDLLDDNTNNRLIIDDGDVGQNPDVINYVPNTTAGDDGDGLLGAADDFDFGGTLRIGAEITAPVQGIMSEGFGAYRVLATETIQIDDSTNDGARPDTPDDVLGNAGGGKLDGQLIVTSFNVLNYFTTLDTAGNQTGPDGDLDPRGATSADDLTRQTDSLVNALLATDSDVLALQELENNGFGDASAIAALVAALNTADPTANWQVVDPTDPTDPTEDGFIGTDAITTGIIYNANEVTLVYSDYLVHDEASAADTFAIADALQSALNADEVGDFQRNRPTTAATFEEKDTGETFTVTSSHFKSKGPSGLEDLAEIAEDDLTSTSPSITQAQLDALLADPNYDQGNGQGFWNQVRDDAAQELTTWLEDTYLPAAELAGDAQGVSVSDDTLILGDFNAYAQEDPTQSVRDFDGADTDTDSDYVDVIDTFVPGGQDEAYSFVFDGQQGTLDQAFATTDLADHITGATEWHINADEPDLLNYDSEFNNEGYFSDDVFAASDHDPLIIGLDFNPLDPIA